MIEVPRCNAPLIVVSVVRAVGQVEGLGDQLQIGLVAELDVLSQPGIQLEERIAAQRIVLGDRAACRYAIQAVEAVLCASVIAREREGKFFGSDVGTTTPTAVPPPVLSVLLELVRSNGRAEPY